MIESYWVSIKELMMFQVVRMCMDVFYEELFTNNFKRLVVDFLIECELKFQK